MKTQLVDTPAALSAEASLFLFLSRLGVSDDALLTCLEEILRKRGSIDFSIVCALALANGTAGFVYNNIESSGLFPEAALHDLRSWHDACLASNTRLLAETKHLLTLLAEETIPVIPLKGAIASELLFADLGVYPSGDIDLLVPETALAEVKALLCRCGYSRPREIAEQDLIASHYHLMLSKEDFLCEVHWNCVKRYFAIPAGFWWEEACEARLADGSVVWQLNPEKYLLYLIFRLFDHCFYPLRFLVIISAVISRYRDAISWEKLMAHASRLRMRRLILFVFELLHDLQGIELPAQLVHKKILGQRQLKALVRSGLLKGIRRPHLRMAAYTLLLDSPTAILRILWGRLAPSSAELRLRYDIPIDSPWIFFYHVFNPFFLLFASRRTTPKVGKKP